MRLSQLYRVFQIPTPCVAQTGRQEDLQQSPTIVGSVAGGHVFSDHEIARKDGYGAKPAPRHRQAAQASAQAVHHVRIPLAQTVLRYHPDGSEWV